MEVTMALFTKTYEELRETYVGVRIKSASSKFSSCRTVAERDFDNAVAVDRRCEGIMLVDHVFVVQKNGKARRYDASAFFRNKILHDVTVCGIIFGFVVNTDNAASFLRRPSGNIQGQCIVNSSGGSVFITEERYVPQNHT